MAATLHALDYLAAPARHPAAAVCVVFGDDQYLKREVLLALRGHVLGEDDGSFSMRVFDGEVAEYRDIVDELSTVSMFGDGPRLVLVEGADKFVTRYREQLEDYVARQTHRGVLVLEVKTWASNTRLYKKLSGSGLQIDCKAPSLAQLRKWLTLRASDVHKTKIDAAALGLLLEQVPHEPGLLDQELGRLALLTGESGAITVKLVRDHIHAGLTKKVWDMVDAAAEGNTQTALEQLDRLLQAGEQPIALLAQSASVLRRLAAAAQLVDRAQRAGRRIAPATALLQAGTPKYFVSGAETQLRQVGLLRARKLYRWLLDADLALKGWRSRPEEARIVLEQLVVRLSPAANAQKPGQPTALLRR